MSVSGLENMCAQKKLFTSGLAPENLFLAFTTVPCSSGLPRCSTQPEDRELRSFLCVIPSDPQAREQPAWGRQPPAHTSVPREVGGWSPRLWGDP